MSSQSGVAWLDEHHAGIDFAALDLVSLETLDQIIVQNSSAWEREFDHEMEAMAERHADERRRALASLAQRQERRNVNLFRSFDALLNSGLPRSAHAIMRERLTKQSDAENAREFAEELQRLAETEAREREAFELDFNQEIACRTAALARASVEDIKSGGEKDE